MANRMSNYWILRIRTHEWAEHESVSLLDIDGIGKATLDALYALEIDTISKLIAADPNELAEMLQKYGLPQCKRERAPGVIQGWQNQARQLINNRSS